MFIKLLKTPKLIKTTQKKFIHLPNIKFNVKSLKKL